jgi:hypothetical protein
MLKAKVQGGAARLNFQKVRPGDVIVTGRLTLPSRVIAKATNGVYSHAAVVLRDKDFKFSLLEAVPPAVQLSPIAGPVEVPPALGVLLRHPQLETMHRRKFDEISGRFVAQVRGLPYAGLERLLEATHLSGDLKSRTSDLGRRLDILQPESSCDGFYCSELVSSFFSFLGLRLWNGSPPSAVGPNDLVRPTCLLRVVPEAFS